jgi:hypothetical protein
MRTFIGIDIGLEGGIAIGNETAICETMVMPVTKEGELDIDRTKSILDHTMGDRFVIFENITPLHLASKKANWSLAKQSGAIEAICICLNIPYIAVLPKVWQKDMFQDIPPIRKKEGTTDTKAQAAIAVRKIHPDMNFKIHFRKNAKDHNGIIDAVLLIEWWKMRNKI